MAALEGGVGAVAFASGLAANMAVLELLSAGDRLVAPLEAYYGSLRQFTEHAARRGVTVSCVDFTRPRGGQSGARRQAHALLWIETPTNPLLNVADLRAVTALGHEAGALVVCDNTFATPICQRPFDFGVDIVVHSGTKYLGGHSDVLSGVLIVREDSALLERLRTWQRDGRCSARTVRLLAAQTQHRDAGAARSRPVPGCAAGGGISRRASPRSSRSSIRACRSIRATPSRRRRCPGASARSCRCVSRAAKRRRCAPPAARASSPGRPVSARVESLIEHRASIEGPGSRTPQNLLRLSIGIEEPEDLIDDLAQALQ